MEIMSPAGDINSFYAAIENQADAVYLGLPVLNARKPAKNFSLKEIKIAIETAHSKNVKVFVTLNIDIKSSELKTVIKALAYLSELKADAVIVKDLAVIYLINKFFPTLPIHISTQFGISNTIGLKAVQNLNAERVVLSREVSFGELTEIMQSENIPEIEIFVQGSMCFSFSGKCLMSSWIGGKSANRGNCLAPCRFKYETNDTKKFNSYFSMKDLSLIEDLHKFDKMGVSAVKIEGRLKNHGWVGKITSIYRNSFENNNSDDINKLHLYSGRKLGKGFLHGLKHLTAENNIDFGVYKGKVLKVANGYSYLDFNSVEPNISLRFVTDKFLFFSQNPQINQDENGEYRIKTEDKVVSGAKVYEVRSVANDSNFDLKNEYNLIISLEDDLIKCKIILKEDSISFSENLKRIVKEKRAVYISSIADKLAGSFFNGRIINDIEIKEDFIISKSQIKSLIKNISSAITKIVNENNFKHLDIQNKELQNIINVPRRLSLRTLPIILENTNSLKIRESDIEQITYNCGFKTLIISDLSYDLEKIKNVGKTYNIMLSLFPIMFQNDIKELKTFLEEVHLYFGKNISYEVNDISQLQILKDLKIDSKQIFGGSFMVTYNFLSADYLHELGLNSVHLALEADMDTLKDVINYSQTNLRMQVYGKIPLFISRAQSTLYKENQRFCDNTGITLINHKYNGQNIFYGEKPFSIKNIEFYNLNINELIADFGGEKDILDKFKELKQGKINTLTESFNLRRKLY